MPRSAPTVTSTTTAAAMPPAMAGISRLLLFLESGDAGDIGAPAAVGVFAELETGPGGETGATGPGVDTESIARDCIEPVGTRGAVLSACIHAWTVSREIDLFT